MNCAAAAVASPLPPAGKGLRAFMVSTPPQAVAYIRVSKDEQQLSPDAQREAITRYAAIAGISVASWHEDLGVCSVDPIDKRPALVTALTALSPGDVLLVAKRDRLARDVVLAALIGRAVEARGAAVVSAMGEGNGATPADEFMRTVIDGAAQYERALIRARTKAALGVLRARGHKTGGAPPYGYTVGPDGRTLVPDPREASQVATARALAARGTPLRGIARALGPCRTGEAFSAAQVRRILARV